jgi:probable F420-dependent oxidoreductase
MATATPRGVTMAPLMTLGLRTALDVAKTAESLGYRSFWTAEVTGPEAFATLGAVAATTELSVGTGVLALQLRTPPLLAMAGATLQALAPDRDVLLGVGISSPVVAGRWHGAGYGDRPLAQVREFVALLRACLSGERVDFAGDFYEIKGFRLGVRLPEGRQPKIVVGALNEGMLRLAGEVADGVLLNYLPSSHVPWSVEQVRKGGDARIYAYVHAGVGNPADGDKPARFDLFSYAVVDSYARNFERAGYGDSVAEVRARHQAGDRDGALAAVSDDFIAGIDFLETEDEVRGFFDAYVAAGVEEPIVFPLPWGADRAEVVRRTLEAVAPTR